VVSGTITYKNQPVNGATLVLISTDANGGSVTIPVSQEGTFSSSDVPPGEYKIVVEVSEGVAPFSTARMDPAKKAEADANLAKMKKPPTIPILKKYKSAETTDLKREIVKGDQKLDLEMTD
jgi:hypothetical protein